MNRVVAPAPGGGGEEGFGLLGVLIMVVAPAPGGGGREAGFWALAFNGQDGGTSTRWAGLGGMRQDLGFWNVLDRVVGRVQGFRMCWTGWWPQHQVGGRG